MEGLHDYWLRGDTESDVTDAVSAAGIPLLPSTESSFDPIGTIYDGNGDPVPGWHANLRLRYEMTEMQVAVMGSILIPPPANPVRVWG